jgi:photosystem II stability/assembly factor-like uncharacterized protein
MTRVLALAALTFMGSVSAAEWEPVATDLLKAEKTGFGGLCGVAVDHATGDVLVDLSDRGLFRSADRGKTWARHGLVVKGRTEWPGCLLFDPTGKSKRLLMALVYGAPVGVSSDAGTTWTQLDPKAQHVDWAVMDWSETKFILALKHEADGLLLASRDGGKSFAEVGKGYGPAWVFDGTTAVVAEAKSKDRPKPRLMRTTDAGKTWDAVGEHTATALPKWRGETLYWLADGALLSTADRGRTWKRISDVRDGQYGPVFGKDDRHLFVLTRTGILESTDGGATWGKPVPLPKELKGSSPLTWLDYDPKADMLYVMRMGSDLYRLVRK